VAAGAQRPATSMMSAPTLLNMFNTLLALYGYRASPRTLPLRRNDLYCGGSARRPPLLGGSRTRRVSYVRERYGFNVDFRLRFPKSVRRGIMHNRLDRFSADWIAGLERDVLCLCNERREGVMTMSKRTPDAFEPPSDPGRRTLLGLSAVSAVALVAPAL